MAFLLEPLVSDTAAWFAELDRLNGELFLKSGSKQPKTTKRKIFS
jgi:hypothetical protein